MNTMTRRELLKSGAHAAAALCLPGVLVGCASEQGRRIGGLVDSGQRDVRSRVAAIKGDDLYEMTRQALDALGGIGKVVGEGESVFIKPNMINLPWAQLANPFLAGECTKPEILIAVAEQCLIAGASEVVIGDASHRPSFDWANATTLDGSTNLKVEVQRLAAQYGRKVALACLDTESPRLVEIPSSTYLGKIAVSSLAMDADRVISVPVLKTHTIAQLTLSLKNLLGITALQKYSVELPRGENVEPLLWRMDSFDHSSPEAIAAIYLDIAEAVKPDLAIIDASIGLEGDGPAVMFGGKTVDMKDRLGSWTLLASTDPVAADATAARITGQRATDIKQLVMAHDRGLGELDEDAIDMLGEKLDNLKVEWTPAQQRSWTKPPHAA